MHDAIEKDTSIPMVSEYFTGNTIFHEKPLTLRMDHVLYMALALSIANARSSDDELMVLPLAEPVYVYNRGQGRFKLLDLHLLVCNDSQSVIINSKHFSYEQVRDELNRILAMSHELKALGFAETSIADTDFSAEHEYSVVMRLKPTGVKYNPLGSGFDYDRKGTAVRLCKDLYIIERLDRTSRDLVIVHGKGDQDVVRVRHMKGGCYMTVFGHGLSARFSFNDVSN